LRVQYLKYCGFLLHLLLIILIVPVDAHTCESSNVIKRQNIKIIQLDGQQNPILECVLRNKNCIRVYKFVY